MKTIKWLIMVIAAATIGYYMLSEKQESSLQKTLDNTENTDEYVSVIKRYDDKGNLKTDAEIVDGMRNGVAHNYYEDGSVHSEMHYLNNKKHGESIWFYKDGKKYRVTPYVEGKKDGIQKKFYKNGQIMAEIPYAENILQPGTKEYSEQGSPIKQQFSFDYKTINKLASNNVIVITITGKQINKVTAYKAFVKSNNAQLNGDREGNSIHFYLPVNEQSAKNPTVVIWLTSKTKMNNPTITEYEIVVS